MLAFSRGVTGLRIAEQNLYVTSNNLSNVETAGYHRQRLNQYSFQTTARGNFQVGLGVDADSVWQIRSEFLETNYRNELASYGEYKYESKVYDSIQAIVGNDGSSVQDCITDLWESFNELTKEYTTTVAGGYLRENAVSLISELDSISQQLDKLQNELDVEVRNTVKKINDYSTKIAQLNDQITRAEADGSLACELRDSRDSIIASLSELVELSVENTTNTCVNIRTANGYLVVRTQANLLDTDQIIPESTFCSPIWAATGEEFEVGSGELKGILDMRGGHVVGNLEHSSNGAPKEQMDVVVSIDTDMDHKSIDDMFRNINNMIDILDRQSANYKLYLTDGTEVTGKQLKDFLEKLYSDSIMDEVDNYNGTSVSEFMAQLKGAYGINSQSLDDMWSYVEYKGGSVNDLNTGFRDYVEQKETDSEKRDEMLNIIDDYLDGLEDDETPTLSGLSKYLNSQDNTTSIESLENYMSDYVDDTVPAFNEAEIKDYITNTLHDVTGVIPNMDTANSDNVLENISKATIIDFRKDSNKYFLVFTDNEIDNPITRNDVAARMNAIDMRLIAVTNEESSLSWKELAKETDGNVIDIAGFESLEGTEEIALSITRDFNSRLVGEGIESGITSFRAGLNALLNGFAKEINGIFRQGENSYHERHGTVMKDKAGNEIIDPETGEAKIHNFDLFLKIDEDLPLQMGNVRINPVFTDVNKLPLSLTGDTGDFQIGNKLVDLAYTDIYNSGDSYSTLDEYYANFILDFAQAANASAVGYETQNKVLNVASEKIQAVSGVSMDEELSNMVKFQYSYTAASKMINVVDEMLETIMRL